MTQFVIGATEFVDLFIEEHTRGEKVFCEGAQLAVVTFDALSQVCQLVSNHVRLKGDYRQCRPATFVILKPDHHVLAFPPALHPRILRTPNSVYSCFYTGPSHVDLPSKPAPHFAGM